MKILATLLTLTLITAGIVTLSAQGVKTGIVSPGGMDGSVQFNDVGNFGGSHDFRYDKNTNRLIINGGMLDMSGSVIRGVLYPECGDCYDIGSESNSWAGLYLGADEVIYFGNVPILSQEVGGGDTYINATTGKAVRIQKRIILERLDTFDPHSSNHVWRDSEGYLRISAG